MAIGDVLNGTRTWFVHCGDAMETLKTMPDECAHCVVTSPPYWGLRDYGVNGQIGMETTPEKYVERMTEVFREVWRILRVDGTAWLNLADSYTSGTAGRNDIGRMIDGKQTRTTPVQGESMYRQTPGHKRKNLAGIPWRVALALQEIGYYVRSDIIWAKANPLPESVTDRPTKSHEHIFLLAKSETYWYDAEAIKEPAVSHLYDKRYLQGESKRSRVHERWNCEAPVKPHNGFRSLDTTGGRNRRDVWTFPTEPHREAHFAIMPTKIAELCILAGCPPGGIVLDPFSGAGTTGLVALRHGRRFIGIELKEEYVKMSRNRILNDAPLFNANSFDSYG